MKRITVLGATLALLLSPVLVRLLKAQAPAPAAQLVYTTVPSKNWVVVVDSATNSVVNTITIAAPTATGSGTSPSSIAFTPDAKFAYVVNQGCDATGSAVSVIDSGQEVVVATIPVPGCPHEIALAPDGLHGYVTTRLPSGVGAVTVLDLAAKAVVTTVNLTSSDNPSGVAVSPTSDVVHFGKSDGIYALATATNTLTSTVIPDIQFSGSNCPVGEIAGTPDGNFLLVTCFANEAVLLDAHTGRAIFNALVSCTIGAPAITPDGTKAFVPDSECGGILDISMATGVSKLFFLPGSSQPTSRRIAFTSDGTKAFASGFYNCCSQAGQADVEVFNPANDAPIADVTVAFAPTSGSVGIAVMPTTVSTLSTTTTLVSSVSPSAFGQQVSFTATVVPGSSSANVPTGTLTFSDGNTILGSVTPLTNGSATFTTSGLSVGGHLITASYSGDNKFGASTSTALTETVGQAGTVTSLRASANTLNVGQAVTFTATVTVVAPGAGTPTGAVTFSANGAFLTCTGGSQTVSAGQATCQYAFGTAGAESITASYNGDTNFTGSTTASPVSVAVSPPPSSVPVQITDNETITVTDAELFPDVFGGEAVHVADAVFVTPLIQVSAPVAEFSAGSLGFSGQSSSQTITVSDIGTGSLMVASATISGSSQFAITQVACSNSATSASTTLLSGGACVLTISYSASATPANDIATLVFSDNAAMSNVASVPAGSSYTQSIALSGGGSTTAPPPPPPAVVPVLDNETIFVTDTPSSADAYDTEKITITDQVSIHLLNTTTTSISAPTVTYGTAASATVSVGALTGTAAGNVTLALDGGAPTTMPLTSHFDPLLELAVGYATFNLGILNAGNHTLMANFPAQGNFTASSAQAALKVNQATPQITWANPLAVPGPWQLQSVQLNATASVAGTFTYNPPAGTMLAVGSQTLSVTFTPADTTNYTTATATSTLQVTNGLPTTTLVTCDSLIITAGSATSCGAEVLDSWNGGINKIVPRGTVSWTAAGPIANPGGFSPNTCTLPSPPGGSLVQGRPASNDCSANYGAAAGSQGTTTITASYSGDTINAPSSGTFSLSVIPPPINTTTMVTSSANPSVYGQPVTFTVVVKPSSGTIAPTGSVQFTLDGSTSAIGINTTSGCPSSDLCATYTPPLSLIVGSHTVDVLYLPTGNFAISYPPQFTQTVNVASTVTSLSSSVNPSILGQSVTLKATVTALSPSTGTPDGSVIFYDGGLGLPPCFASTILSGGAVSCTLSSLSAGSHMISATYVPGAYYQTSSPSTITQTVLNTPTGPGVTVQPVAANGASPVSLLFTNVSQPGLTTLTITDSGPATPSSFAVGTPPTYFNLSTTAIYTPPITVCINYAGISFPNNMPALFHYQNGAWVNVTISVDTTHMIVCGNVMSLSPFALFAPLPVLTITTNSVSRQYGQPNPSLNNVTYTGFVNGDTSSVLSGTLSCVSPATPATPVGTYPITCSGLTSPNYTINLVRGTLTVTAAPLAITANNRSKTYGQTVTFAGTEFTTSGLVNTDTVTSVVLTSPGAAVTASVAGSPYPITPSAALGTGLGNYTISYVNGTLTVTPALLTITGNNATKILNAPNPSSLGWTATGLANGENTSVLTANPSCTTTATTTSPVGSYPITCSGANAANYAFSYVAGTLKIQYATSVGHVIQPPINADGTSVFNQGRTIPAKFNVYDANGVPISTPGVVSSFFLTGIISGTVNTTVENVVDTNNPDTAFRWDGQEWIFNITTANLSAGSTNMYTITLNDGSTIMFKYGLR